EPRFQRNEKPGYNDEGMVRLYVDVGHNKSISPSDIVGAIANEGNVPGKAIGAIDIYDRFTLVDVPSEFTGQVLEQMHMSRIRSQKANVRVADSGDASENTRKPFEKPRKSFERERDGFEKPRKTFENARHDYADKSGGDKPLRRKKPDERENPYKQYEKPGGQKKTNARPKFEAKTAKPKKKLIDGKKKPKWTKEQRAERSKYPKSK
ncbi:MAG TPA: DbpA RNA binding domain-containing protein, partial [Pyrinomonadaceae bacterium]|nr:DbpA RNA binding domain-containing protein [Pyrinomonadaceae bacterium]